MHAIMRQEVFQIFFALPTKNKKSTAFRSTQSALWGGQEHTLAGFLPYTQSISFLKSLKELSGLPPTSEDPAPPDQRLAERSTGIDNPPLGGNACLRPSPAGNPS